MKIIYCLTDEASLLATYSLFPIINSFAQACNVPIEISDISLASRILAQFPDHLTEDQRQPDTLSELIKLSETRDANIIKLPSISASLLQLRAAISELQRQGYAVPDYPDEVTDERQESVRACYAAVLGSVVNASLRRGNSERRIPDFIKAECRRQRHSNKQWSSKSRSHVATMTEGDFRSTEQAVTVAEGGNLRIEHVSETGVVTVLKESIAVLPGDVVDCGVMRRDALERFFVREIESARRANVLFSLQLKCTTMRVSDPLIFRSAVRVYYAPVLAAYDNVFSRLAISPEMGSCAIRAAIDHLAAPEEFERLLDEIHRRGPQLAMVDIASEISTLYAPGGISIGAAMATALKEAGQMLNAEGQTCDTKFVIPDHAYSDLYKEIIESCTSCGALDPGTMGSVVVIGLTAEAAEEYGSQDKTFEIESPGLVRIVDERGIVLLQENVAARDIWRMCQVTNIAIQDWIMHGIECARRDRVPAVFWLDETRPRDRELLRKVRQLLMTIDMSGLDISTMNVAGATRFTLAQLRKGHNVIAVTGNLLRDYLTELFSGLEGGTSARVQATTKLLKGGTLFETGSGGCAPKHVSQFLDTNHLRWNSHGEVIALAASLELFARTTGNKRSHSLAQALKRASQHILAKKHVASPRVGELDTRGSHFYLAYYWAREMESDEDVGSLYAKLAQRLARDSATIERELLEVQGSPVELGGYYRPDTAELSAAMRPSKSLNEALLELSY